MPKEKLSCIAVSGKASRAHEEKLQPLEEQGWESSCTSSRFSKADPIPALPVFAQSMVALEPSEACTMNKD
jgi:hypothetical protein